jgi:thiamine biosynthesis lipoprotein
MAAERRFRAMGSDAHLVVVGGGDGLLEAAQRRIDDLERRWSRFLENSEISRLNRHAGEFVEVSPDTVTLIERAVSAWRLSGGAFDPTVLGSMLRAGYDRSFDVLGPARHGQASLLGIGAADIVIAGSSVCLPGGSGFDPGGIGKGLAADLVAAEMVATGADGACVNLGGDIRVLGVGPAGAAWTIAVEHPWSVRPIAMLGLGQGAVATSTTLRRRWLVDGQPRHHLIDPQTGLPSETDLTAATVVAAEAWMAEVLAKTVLLAGSAHRFGIIGGTGAQALVVDTRGRIDATAGMADYLGGAALPFALESARIRWAVPASSEVGT